MLRCDFLFWCRTPHHRRVPGVQELALAIWLGTKACSPLLRLFFKCGRKVGTPPCFGIGQNYHPSSLGFIFKDHSALYNQIMLILSRLIIKEWFKSLVGAIV